MISAHAWRAESQIQRISVILTLSCAMAHPRLSLPSFYGIVTLAWRESSKAENQPSLQRPRRGPLMLYMSKLEWTTPAVEGVAGTGTSLSIATWQTLSRSEVGNKLSRWHTPRPTTQNKRGKTASRGASVTAPRLAPVLAGHTRAWRVAARADLITLTSDGGVLGHVGVVVRATESFVFNVGAAIGSPVLGGVKNLIKTWI